MSNLKGRIQELDLAAVSTFAGTGEAVVSMYNQQGCPYSGSLCVTVAAPANGSNKTFASGDVNTTTNVVTITAHGFSTGQIVTLTTSGGLPAPLLTATNYYIISLTANTVQFASSLANAAAGTGIDITTTGSGTQTVTPTAVGYSVFLDASNDGTRYVPYYSYEGMSTAQTWQWLLQPEFKYYKFRRVVTGGAITTNADLLLLGESA